MKGARWRPGSERLWSIAGYGFALVLAADAAFKEDQVALAVVEAILGVGILLATYLLSSLRVPYPGLQATLEFTFWNIALLVAFVVVFLAGGFAFGEGFNATLAFGLPCLAGAWLVVLAARFARRRSVVLAMAAVAGLLFAAQCAFYGFALSGGQRGSIVPFGIHLAVVAVAGPALLAWLILAKRRRWNGEAVDAPEPP